MTKDWKGNSDSVRGRLSINKDHTTSGREENDFYATDPKALELFLDNCSYSIRNLIGFCTPAGGEYIWECAAGVGNLSDVLKARGYNVLATELRMRGTQGIIEGIDFLTVNPEQRFKGRAAHPFVILTNPPYSLANEFILHALDILPDYGLYIALMNISYMCGKKRYEQIYSRGNLRHIYIFSKRVECWRNNDKEKYGKKAMVDFAWYVFQKGYNGQPTIYWL